MITVHEACEIAKRTYRKVGKPETVSEVRETEDKYIISGGYDGPNYDFNPLQIDKKTGKCGIYTMWAPFENFKIFNEARVIDFQEKYVMDHYKVDVSADTSQLDDVTEKLEKFTSLIKQANSLMDELAHKEVNISFTSDVQQMLHNRETE